MPRKPSVPHQELTDAIMLAKEDLIDKTTKFILGPTAEIWKQLALKLNNMVSPRYIYQYVKQNRHEIQDVLGLKQTSGTSSPTYTASTSSFSDTDMVDVEEVTQMVQPKQTFLITFSPEDWRTIQPVETKYKRKDRSGTRVRMVLPPNRWSNKIVEKLWEGHKLPCPYTIHRGTVTSGEDTEYIKISAKCKECGAHATGVVLFKPIDGESVSLSWRAPDTRKVPHQKSRWLSGPQREKVGQELKRNCASVYRRELAFLNMDQGDPKPPILYSNAVLRKAKQEAREKELGTQGHGCPVISLVNMKHSARYAGTIHDIGIDKFFVHYYTPAQLLLFKKHCRASYTKLSVDATGTLVKKIVHTPQRKSGHIFLYESVLTAMPKSGPPESIPVSQMLSEKHDANSIIYWLNEWRRAGAPLPDEVVIDNSAALKNAVARVFVGVDIKTYINTCFRHLAEGGDLPKTYLRLDVAHYLNAACKWGVWAEKKRIKEFYMRCLGILINAECLTEFTERFTDILTVASSPCKADSAGNNFPVAECLSRLAKVMRDQKIEFCETEPEEEQVRLADSGDIELALDVDHWLSAIKKQVIRYDDPEGELNPYHLPDVEKEFYRIAAEFVLWSNVATRGFGSPFNRGTSSPVESFFSDLKCNILKGESKPLKVDNFVATHIKAIEGACRISNTTLDNQRLTKTIKDSASDDLNEVENWRGLGAPKRSKYFSDFPGADVAIASANYKFAAQGVLRNGTGKIVTTADGTVLYINNTCCFDALCHVVTNAYLTCNLYRDQMAESDNRFIKTAISLGHKGPDKDTYMKRAEALSSVLEPKAQLRMPETRRKTRALEYDAFGNAANLLNKMIPPHTSQEVMCEVEIHRAKRMVVEPNCKTLFEQGWEGLVASIQDWRQKCAQCICLYGDHIFVDVEYLSDENAAKIYSSTARLYALSELPKQLSFGNDVYTLTGVVAYEELHYVAYCFNICIWRKYDDLSPKEFTVDETTKIWPSILMYVHS